VIKTIRHKGLKRLFEKDDQSRVDARLAPKLRRVLFRLQGATVPEDMSQPGYGLHPLSGDLKGFWAVRVSGNWRVTFRFQDGHAFDVDLVDYH
jgi:proteic killer suppression protein